MLPLCVYRRGGSLPAIINQRAAVQCDVLFSSNSNYYIISKIQACDLVQSLQIHTVKVNHHRRALATANLIHKQVQSKDADSSN